MLLGEGRGFEIAQGRLGPGRIHHCMRQIGLAERALERMCQRTLGRVAFGKPVAEQGVTLERIAESRIMIEQARLLTLNAAHRMDTVGNKRAKTEIAMIKVAVPNMAAKVIDWAIQAYGGGGTSNDFGLAPAYAMSRIRACRRPRRGAPQPDRQAEAEEVPVVLRLRPKSSRPYKEFPLQQSYCERKRSTTVAKSHAGASRGGATDDFEAAGRDNRPCGRTIQHRVVVRHSWFSTCAASGDSNEHGFHRGDVTGPHAGAHQGQRQADVQGKGHHRHHHRRRPGAV
jgi:hypothetical protein